MRRIGRVVAGMGLFAAFLFVALSSAMSAEVPRMTKDELRTLIEEGDVTVVDVRTGRDWKSSEYKIHTAVREDAGQVASWATKYPKDKTLVLYCA